MSNPHGLPAGGLILGSTSPFRRELLGRLELPFSAASPDTDETAHAGELPEALVQRLAEAKARAVAPMHPDALIIGSDQIAVLDGQILGKPGNHARAVEQLRAASGRTVTFLTGLCLLDSASDVAQVTFEPFRVHFRELDEAHIERYLQAEQPYNCAGSFKSEGLGIALFAKLEGDDPTGLIGLPLIRLVDMLQRAGVAVP